jgi:hypothetical protein
MDKATLGRLKRMRDEMVALVASVEGEVQETDWERWFRRAGAVLNEVDAASGVVDKGQWREIGIRNGYDPRGLAGFYTGHDPSMERDAVTDERKLTARGQIEAQNWRRLFKS